MAVNYRYVITDYFDESGDLALTAGGVSLADSGGVQQGYVSRAISGSAGDDQGVCDLNVTGATVTVGTNLVFGEATLASTATVSTTSTRIRHGVATLNANTFGKDWANGGTWGAPTQEKWGPPIVVEGAIFTEGEATLACTATTSTSAIATFSGSATLTGTGATVNVGVGAPFGGSATLSSTATVSADAIVLTQGSATLGITGIYAVTDYVDADYFEASASALECEASRTRSSPATLATTGTVSTQGNATFIGASTLAITGATVIAAVATFVGTVLNAGSATLSVSASPTFRSTVTLASAATIPTVRGAFGFTVTLPGVSTLTVIGGNLLEGVATLGGVLATVTVGERLLFAPYRTFTIQTETRSLTLQKETRKHPLLSEKRVNSLPQETRKTAVSTETRQVKLLPGQKLVDLFGYTDKREG